MKMVIVDIDIKGSATRKSVNFLQNSEEYEDK
jgi:hypothetical protein